MTDGDSAAAVRSLVAHVGPGVERQVSTDQANLSVAVDEQYLVKWFRDPVDRPTLELSSSSWLRGASRTCRSFVGAVFERRSGTPVAVVSELDRRRDRWVAVVRRRRARLARRRRAAGLDALIGTAARMGAITAELHEALRSTMALVASRLARRAVRSQVAERRARWRSAHTAGERRRATASRGCDQIDSGARPCSTGDGTCAVQRIHGDLHAGQFLRAGDRLLVTDFDGDPMTASADRVDLQPVERDVAALLQSIDHVGRVAAQRRPGADVRTVRRRRPSRPRTAAYRAAHPIDDAAAVAIACRGRSCTSTHTRRRACRCGATCPMPRMCALFPATEDGPR